MKKESHIKKWKELGPISVVSIVKNTPVELLFDPYKVELELKEVELKDGTRI